MVAEAVPGLRVSASSADRLAYARDLWPRRLIELRAGRGTEHQPGLVVWPRTVEDVVRIVRFAAREGVPVVPFGAGSGVCGAVLPDERTIVIDVKEMADWSIDRDAPSLDVGPGAMGITLEEDVQRQGYTIGHFPSSIVCSTVGGWIAGRGAGQCSGLYGKIEDMVAAVECVTGDGEAVTFQRRSGGPNLVPLIVGSEGTLGVITRATLRLHTAPTARAFAAFSFADIEAGWEAMRALFQSGLRPAVARLYDAIDSALMRQGTVKAPALPIRTGSKPKKSSTRSSRLAKVLRSALRAPQLLNAAIEAAEGNLLGGCTLVLVFEGASEEVHADAERATALCRAARGRHLGEGPARRWLQHRYGVSYRQSPVFRLGAFSDTMEVAAPWSRFGDLFHGVRAALGEHVLVMAHMSHAYPDGCSIYFTFSAVGKDDDDALAIYDRAWRSALDAAIAAGGTLSHHHGVGRSKAPKLGQELGWGIEGVRRVMRAFDPAGIFNPGALTPREGVTIPEGDRLEKRTAPAIDDVSLTATLPGDMPLSVAEAALAERGLTLALDPAPPPDARVAAWVAAGLPGTRSPWSDPVTQGLSGLEARIGERGLSIRAAPRRAVGPDLTALFVGAGERVGTVESATVLVQRQGAPAARALPFARSEPALSPSEDAVFARVARVMRED